MIKAVALCVLLFSVAACGKGATDDRKKNNITSSTNTITYPRKFRKYGPFLGIKRCIWKMTAALNQKDWRSYLHCFGGKAYSMVKRAIPNKKRFIKSIRGRYKLAWVKVLGDLNAKKTMSIAEYQIITTQASGKIIKTVHKAIFVSSRKYSHWVIISIRK